MPYTTKPVDLGAAIDAGTRTVYNEIAAKRQNYGLRQDARDDAKAQALMEAQGDRQKLLDAYMRAGDVAGAGKAAEVFEYFDNKNRRNKLSDMKMGTAALDVIGQAALYGADNPELYPYIRRLLIEADRDENGVSQLEAQLPEVWDENTGQMLRRISDSMIRHKAAGKSTRAQYGEPFRDPRIGPGLYQLNSDGKLVAVSGSVPPEFKQKIAMAVANGVPENIATMEALGYVERMTDPMSFATKWVDVGSGEVLLEIDNRGVKKNPLAYAGKSGTGANPVPENVELMGQGDIPVPDGMVVENSPNPDRRVRGGLNNQ